MSCRKGLVDFISETEVLTPVVDVVSQFVPDQSLSIRDIITRFAIVGDVNSLNDAGEIGEDDEYDDAFDLARMDIAELQELNERSAQILRDYEAARNDVKPGVDSSN